MQGRWIADVPAPAHRKSPPLRALGDRVRERRTELGLTQERLGEAAGLHRTYVGTIESAHRNPSYLALLKLARGLEIDLGDLLKGLDPSRR